jgi:putative ATP-binding cassette transporter
MQFVKECKQYGKLIFDYWGSKKSFQSWLALFGALGFSWFFVYLSVHTNQLFGNLYDFVEQRDKLGVLSTLKQYAGLFSLFIFAYALKSFLTSLAVFRWRQFLSEKIVGYWLEMRKYHHVKMHIDNPDQRISEDINFFSTNFLNTILIFFVEGFTFIAFIGVLWNFPYSIDLQLFGHEVSIPHYLAIGSGVYAILMNIALIWIGKPVIGLDYEKERKEADYRYVLMRINSHSEEIAFHSGEKIEKEICNSKFKGIKTNYYALVKRNFSVNLFGYGYSATLSILPILAGMPLFFADKISFGELMRIGGAATSVLFSLGVLITNFQLIASLQAAKNRLIKFLNSLEQLEDLYKKKSTEKVVENQAKIGLFNVTLTNQEEKALLKNLKFEVELGKKLLIVGKSGIGKSSILRCFAKIWMPDEGKIHLPKDEIYFIPQRPYLPIGTLATCLFYPAEVKGEDGLVEEVLESVGLEHLIKNLQVEKDYLKILSLGELQRLNFAKIILHQPKILVMDEPTSSLDDNFENLMFQLLHQKLPKETTIITVSHTKELSKYHDSILDIDGARTPKKEPVLL